MFIITCTTVYNTLSDTMFKSMTPNLIDIILMIKPILIFTVLLFLTQHRRESGLAIYINEMTKIFETYDLNHDKKLTK